MSDLLSLTLCKVDRPLKIHSRLLAADLWLVPAGTTEKFDAPAYSPDECRLLQALELAPDELKAIHLTKKFFQGDLILADEPTGNLDERTGEEVHELLEHLNRDQEASFLIATHNPRLAERMDRVVRIADGRILE